MKAILEFNLPEEYTQLNAAVSAPSVISIMYDVDNKLRSFLKYGNLDSPEECIQCMEECRSMLNEVIDKFD